MDNLNFNLLHPDQHTDAFTNLMFSHRNISFINKPTRISTTMTLMDYLYKLITKSER